MLIAFRPLFSTAKRKLFFFLLIDVHVQDAFYLNYCQVLF